MTTPTQAEPSDPIVELMRSLAADRRFDAMPWRARAACKGETDLFYARAGERPERAQVRESVAVAMCEACPVWRDCRRYARKHREYGVWGGETELERALAGVGGLRSEDAGRSGREGDEHGRREGGQVTKVKVRLAMVPVADLEFGENIRDVPVDVDGLVESVRELGILEPLVCWPNEAGTGVEVGMGKRRLTAARVVGLDEVPCVLRPRPMERERILMQLAENIERADMSPIDEARAFGRLIDLGVTRKTIAQSIRRSENWVYHRTKLLDLPERIRMAVHRGTLPPFVALEFPIALGQDPDVLRRLEQIPELTDTTLRAFIRREWGQVATATGKNTNRGVRVIAIPDHDTYDLAKNAAKKAGVPVGEWTVAAIRAYADRGAQTEAVA